MRGGAGDLFETRLKLFGVEAHFVGNLLNGLVPIAHQLNGSQNAPMVDQTAESNFEVLNRRLKLRVER